MIIGNLNHLSLAGLPAWVRNILLRPECSLSALSTREDGRWQPEGCRWFCTLGTSDTQPAELRHTEYHHLWADIQVVITGCEGINAGTRPIARENDEERKPDLFIAPSPETVSPSPYTPVISPSLCLRNLTRRCAQLARLLQYAKRSLKYRATCWKPKRREK